MWMYQVTVPQFKQMLVNLDSWLGKAVAYADSKKFDPNTLLNARLAPDQFAFARQVQSTCDQAKFTVARLTGKEAPSHPDTEQTIDQLRARVGAVISYLDTFQPNDFNGADERPIELPRTDNKVMLGRDYLIQRQLPNFYFHATTTYAILRHNGVDLGKRDFIGSLNIRDR
ncbi:MAG TPA: DUF1993 domain-containing protein [Polyangiaceae bacterium]|jgi:hypothetical protein